MWPPNPPTLGAHRRSRGAPRYSDSSSQDLERPAGCSKWSRCEAFFSSPLFFRELAVVELAVEPVLVAVDVLLHCHVEVGLEDRYARNVVERELDEPPDQFRILLRVRLEA